MEGDSIFNENIGMMYKLVTLAMNYCPYVKVALMTYYCLNILLLEFNRGVKASRTVKDDET